MACIGILDCKFNVSIRCATCPCDTFYFSVWDVYASWFGKIRLPHPARVGGHVHEADEIWQGCWYTPDHNWNAERLCCWRVRQIRDLIEDIIHFGTSLPKTRPSPLGEEIIEASNCLTASWKFREGGRELSMRTSVHGWRHAWTKHDWSYIHYTRVTRKIPYHQ